MARDVAAHTAAARDDAPFSLNRARPCLSARSRCFSERFYVYVGVLLQCSPRPSLGRPPFPLPSKEDSVQDSSKRYERLELKHGRLAFYTHAHERGEMMLCLATIRGGSSWVGASRLGTSILSFLPSDAWGDHECGSDGVKFCSTACSSFWLQVFSIHSVARVSSATPLTPRGCAGVQQLAHVEG